LALMTVFFTGGGNQSPRATTAGMMTPGAADSEIRFETKNIEDLVVGEQVLAWNEQTGEQALKPIEETFRRQSTHLRVLRIDTVAGEQQTLQTTDEHPFWTENRGWVEAGDLTSDDTLRDAIGRPARLASTDREDLPTSVAVFNMRVADWHTYLVAEDSGRFPVAVHNSNYTSPTRTDLSSSAGASTSGGKVSNAARAIDKHSPRPTSVWPKLKGDAASRNKMAQDMIDDILTDPKSATRTRHHARYGDIIEVVGPDGRGLRFTNNGTFIGVLEPIIR
ncbi:MAG: polymorphic toxin-type HINT domain-containing protein, partial [Planctomycetota bacterium]|nr:polymorphic toxin-type HINT domain-containing protein [Planctomycetota bacterium]